MFLGKNFIVTYHPEDIHVIDMVWKNFQRDERRLCGSNHTPFMDELANDYMAMIDQIDMDVESIEDQVMEKPDNKLLQQIFHIKLLFNLRRIVAPIRRPINCREAILRFAKRNECITVMCMTTWFVS